MRRGAPATSPSDLCRGPGHQAWAAHRVGERPLLVGTAACGRGEQRVSSGGSLLSLGLSDVETGHPTDLVWGPESVM